MLQNSIIYKLAFKTWFDEQYPLDSDGRHGYDTDDDYEFLKEQLFDAYVAGIGFEQVANKAGM